MTREPRIRSLPADIPFSIPPADTDQPVSPSPRETALPTAADFRCVEDVLGEWMELCTLDERGFSTAEADSVRKVAAFALRAAAVPEPVTPSRDSREALRNAATILANDAAAVVIAPRYFLESAEQQHELGVAVARVRAALADEQRDQRLCVLSVGHQGLHKGTDGSEWSWFEPTGHRSPALVPDEQRDTLDAAWAEAEAAALAWAQGANLYSVEVFRGIGTVGEDAPYYSAAATRYEHRKPDGPPAETHEEEGDGPTPVAALQALAARLKGEKP